MTAAGFKTMIVILFYLSLIFYFPQLQVQRSEFSV